MSLGSLWEWFSGELKYVLFFALAILLIVALVKRSFVTMLIFILAVAFVGIFIINPDTILHLAEWLGGLLDMN